MAKKKDILSGMANAGNSLGSAPLLTNNNWAKSMNEEYSPITSAFRSEDLSPMLAKLQRLHRTHSSKP
jgi:hypothetical protein